MSFILDALKKSETDRQQHSNAEFASVPTNPETSSAPRWIWVAGILLAINLVVLMGLLLRPTDVPPRSVALPIETAPDLSKAASDLPKTLGASVPSFEERVATAQLKAPRQQGNEVVAKPVEAAPEFVRPVVISQDPSAIKTDIVPSVYEVRASGLSNLPELNLDIHVYSPDPEDRFVFINMAKLHEGSQLQEGPVVARITPEGVLLEYQGQRFLLPRE